MGNKNASNKRISNYSKSLSDISKKEISKMPPFTDDELTNVRDIFSKLENKNSSSIEPEKLDEVALLRTLPFYPRIRQLVEEHLAKANIRRLSFEMFVEVLTVFHISTSVEEKYKYMFRIFDWDRDYKLGVQDISKTLGLILRRNPNDRSNVYTEKDLTELAEKYLIKHGDRGFIKPERFREIIQSDELCLTMTVMFD